MPDVVAVLLAAGASRRLGQPKQLLAYRGRPLIQHAAATLLASRCRPVLVVLGAEADRAGAALADLPVELVHNPRWADGVGTSIAAGIAAASARGAGGAVLSLVDQALVTGATIDRLLAARDATGRSIVAARYADTVGVPAYFAAAAFAQLPVGRLLDRVGARPLLFAVEGAKTPLLLATALAPGALGAVFALPVMLLVFGEIPITAWLLGRHLDERWWSRAYAAQYVLSLGIAAATVPLITVLHRATGDQTTLFLLLAVSSLTILLVTFLVPRAPGRPAHAPPDVNGAGLALRVAPPS